MKKPIITISGTLEIKKLAKVLGKYRVKEKSNCIMDIIEILE